MDYTLKELKLPYNISYSKINLFKDCKNKFYFNYLSEFSVPKRTWSTAVIGTAMHSTVEYFIGKLPVENINKKFASELQEYFMNVYKEQVTEAKKNTQYKRTNGWSEKKYTEVAEKQIPLLCEFINRVYNYPSKDELLSEMDLTIPFEYNDKINVTGKVDLVYIVDDQLVSFGDLKTTKNASNFWYVDWENNFQKMIYEYMLLKEVGSFPKRFEYIVSNYLERVAFTKDCYTIVDNYDKYFLSLRAIIDEMWEFINNPDFVQATSNWCHVCEYKEICPAGGYCGK